MICTFQTILLYKGQDLKTLEIDQLYEIILQQDKEIKELKEEENTFLSLLEG